MPKVKPVHQHSYQRKLASNAVRHELQQLCEQGVQAEAANENDVEPIGNPLPEFNQPPVGDAIVEEEQNLIHDAEDDYLLNEENYVADSDSNSIRESEASSGHSSVTAGSESDSEGSDPEEDPSDGSDPDDDPEDFNEDVQFQSEISVWSVQHGITGSATNALLSILRRRHPFLPKDSRTLKKTPTLTEIKELANGQYVHMGVKNSIILKMGQGLVEGCDSIVLKVFTDGIKFYKSVNHEGWPILFSSTSFLDPTPGFFGLFYGTGKPNRIEDFLEEYIEEVRNLVEEGIWFRGRNYPVTVKFYVADAPARAYLKSIMGHSSAHGCERCDQEGDYLRFQTYQSAMGNLRTDESFNLRRDAEHHHEAISPLEDLQTGFISQFPLDPLHLLDLGIFKRFLSFVMRRGPLNARMRGEDIERFQQLLILLAQYIPVEFNRKPTLDRLGRWKATEFGLVFKYLGLVIFAIVFKDEVFRLFLLLHSAVFIYSNDDLITLHFDSAKQFASQFVQYSAQLFGPEFIVYNEHSFLHLGDDVQRYGKLSNFSAYPFESMLGGIKNLILSPAKPLQQIHRRIQEKAKVEARAKRRRANNRLSIEHSNGPVGNLHGTQYSKFECETCTLYISEPNNCVRFSDGKYGLIQNFLSCEDGVQRLLAKTFNTAGDLYEYPLPSSDLGIASLSDLQEGLSSYMFSDILFKCFFMPVDEGSFVAVPLNHMI